MNADGSYVPGFSRWPITCAGMNTVSGILRVGFEEEVRGGPWTYEEQPELRMDVQMFDRELSTLLDKLPPEQRVLFALRYEEELTVPQLAEVMGIPEGTVKSRLHYLLQYLRKKLKVYETL